MRKSAQQRAKKESRPMRMTIPIESFFPPTRTVWVLALEPVLGVAVLEERGWFRMRTVLNSCRARVGSVSGRRPSIGVICVEMRDGG